MSKSDTGTSDQVAAKRRDATASKQRAAKSTAKNKPAAKSSKPKPARARKTAKAKPAPPKTTDGKPSAGGSRRGHRKANPGTDALKQNTLQPPASTTPGADSSEPFCLIRVPMQVRWRDLDAFNHVNNSKFLSYLEEARLQWMMTIAGEWIDENVAPVVAAAHLNYRRPIAWPNEVAIELFVQRLGNTSLTIGHRIVHAQDAEVLYADGNVVMVWIDRNRGEAAALPASVRSACSAG